MTGLRTGDLLRTAAGRTVLAAVRDGFDADAGATVYAALADRLFGSDDAVTVERFGPPDAVDRATAVDLAALANRCGWGGPATSGYLPVPGPAEPSVDTAESPGWEVRPRAVRWGLTPAGSGFDAATGGRLAIVRRERADRLDRAVRAGDPERDPLPAPVLAVAGLDDWLRLCRAHPRSIDPAAKDSWVGWFGAEPVVLPDWTELRSAWASVWLSPWLFCTAEGSLVEEAGVRTAIVGIEPGQVLVLR